MSLFRNRNGDYIEFSVLQASQDASEVLRLGRQQKPVTVFSLPSHLADYWVFICRDVRDALRLPDSVEIKFE